MKVTNATVKGMERKARADQPREIPPLSLIPDETEAEDETTKTGTFKLLTDPADADSPKYSFTMAFADGTQSIRFHIQWYKNVTTIFTGMNITTGPRQVDMVQRLCNGPILTTFSESIERQRAEARIARAETARDRIVRNAGENDVDFQARKQAAYEAVINAAVGPADNATTAWVQQALSEVIRQVCPYKSLEKQKRFMRRKMRKPGDMKVRTYVNHLHRLNFDEMPYLPPQGANQALPNDEIIDIVVFGLPKSWIKEMDRMDFDPFRSGNVRDLVEFCERLESAEDYSGDQVQQNKNSKGNKKQKSHSKSKGKDGEKWCDYHEVNTHNTIDCEVLKKLKASKQGGDGKKPPFNKNKTWTRKSDDAKKEAKKELNALVKKVSQKVTNKVKKDLKAKRKSDDTDKDDDSDNSLNLMDQMEAIDAELKKFDFSEEGEVDEFEV